MPIMRNPFRKTAEQTHDNEHGRPLSQPQDSATANPAAPLSVRPNGAEKQPAEYKLSEISDRGEYLPPSPTEQKSFWSTRSSSSTNTHRSVFSENEPFNISRESFDSYRRSFDISARSPILGADVQRPRQSLDARRARLPGAALPLRDTHVNPPETQPEEFEEVGLNDDKEKPKKHSFLSRFGGGSSNANEHAKSETPRPTSSHHGMNVFGRKRGTSGQGAELASMPQTERASFETKRDS